MENMPPAVRVDEISIGIGAIISTTLKVTHRPKTAPKTHQKGAQRSAGETRKQQCDGLGYRKTAPENDRIDWREVPEIVKGGVKSSVQRYQYTQTLQGLQIHL
ncbi:MAG: hypothetical protein A0129_03295 [Limnobacter sp. CACIAM 66H1]|nr:MAG: hypothetical protein A0129_03295 [Limnobacter sp. CACIAM 66H1]